MISTRSTTEKDEQALMSGLTYFDKNGKIDFKGFKNMISTRSTTEKDEQALMSGLTYFAENGKIVTDVLIGAMLGFCSPPADAEDMARFKANGDTLDVQEIYLKLTEV